MAGALARDLSLSVEATATVKQILQTFASTLKRRSKARDGIERLADLYFDVEAKETL